MSKHLSSFVAVALLGIVGSCTEDIPGDEAFAGFDSTVEDGGGDATDVDIVEHCNSDLDCEDGSPCTIDACSPDIGQCTHTPTSEGEDCTAKPAGCWQSAVCKAGVCVGSTPICKCHPDWEVDDDDETPKCPEWVVPENKCLGKNYCHDPKGSYECLPNPPTIIQCNSGNDTGCRKNLCDPTTVACAMTDVADGVICENLATCMSGGQCKAADCVGGKPKSCDDGNQCTEDACESGKGCVFKPITKVCDDGDGCTKGETCSAGKCTGGVHKECDDASSCTTDSCAPGTGDCVFTPVKDGTMCTPGQDECWGGGQCNAGACKGITATCKCHPEWESDDDPLTPKCSEWADENDKCQGQMYCKKSPTSMYSCAPNPATIETCNTKNDSECSKNLCDPKTGTCGVVQSKNGEPCEDGDICTKGETCISGKCSITDIKSSLLCKCTPTYLDNCYNELGSNPCDGIVYCANFTGKSIIDPKCAQASQVLCDPSKNTGCLKNLCEAKSGKCSMVPTEPAIPGGTVFCEDGDSCTPNDKCVKGACVSGPTNICSCAKDEDCVQKDDGNACNGTLFCDKSQGKNHCATNPASVVDCPTVNDTACVVNFCMPKSGKCVMVPTENIKTTIITKTASGQQVKIIKQQPFPYKVQSFVACNDGNACTVNDSCSGTSCAPGNVNACACQSDSECKGQDDGDLCNGTLFCDKSDGKCKVNPATVKTCPPPQDSQCVSTACEPKTGICKNTSAKEGKICDDGDACTVNESCVKGVCSQASVTYICQCASDADCKPEEDGDVCNGTLYCDKSAGKCLVNPTTVVKCSAAGDSQCEKNVCNKKTGICKMTPVAENLLCDDLDPCTPSSTCNSGVCTGATDTCQCKADGDCQPFEDGNACTGTLHCDKGSGMCVIKPGTVVKCDPGKSTQCSKNECNAKTGKCELAAVADFGTPCDDDSPCTKFDVCVGGSCQPGANTCACATDQDCAAVDGGSLCDGKLFCDKSNPPFSVCAPKPGSKIKCPPPKPGSCIESDCNPKTGKCEKIDGGGCADGKACTKGVCSLNGPDAGKCKLESAPDGTPAGESGGYQVCIAGKPVKAPQGMAMVPGGEFYMGCNPAEENCGKFPKEKQHKVTVSAFWMDTFEARADVFADCVKAGKCKAPSNKDKACNYGIAAKNPHPINCVSWNQAKAYCKWRGPGFRLPTEAEWEKAARGGCEDDDPKNCADDMPRWVWGNVPKADCQMAIMKDPANGKTGCGAGSTAPVGSRYDTDVSVYGIWDLAGNVREWTIDYWDADFYSKSGATAKNPINKVVSSEVVVRGGGWLSAVPDLRAASRGKPGKSGSSHVNIGFRCVKDL